MVGPNLSAMTVAKVTNNAVTTILIVSANQNRNSGSMESHLSGGRPSMSALGQKQTSALQKAMSALLPKADMCSATPYARFVPIADMGVS